VAVRYVAEGHFHAGSIRPKVHACLQLLEALGREALITCPEALSTALDSSTGTQVVH
jgi:carbamate kinase